MSDNAEKDPASTNLLKLGESATAPNVLGLALTISWTILSQFIPGLTTTMTTAIVPLVFLVGVIIGRRIWPAKKPETNRSDDKGRHNSTADIAKIHAEAERLRAAAERARAEAELQRALADKLRTESTYKAQEASDAKHGTRTRLPSKKRHARSGQHNLGMWRLRPKYTPAAAPPSSQASMSSESVISNLDSVSTAVHAQSPSVPSLDGMQAADHGIAIVGHPAQVEKSTHTSATLVEPHGATSTARPAGVTFAPASGVSPTNRPSTSKTPREGTTAIADTPAVGASLARKQSVKTPVGAVTEASQVRVATPMADAELEQAEIEALEAEPNDDRRVRA